MPAIGQVYQPTTYNVGYEPQSEWPQQPRRNRFSKFVDWLKSDECCRKIFIGSCSVIILFILVVIIDAVLALFGYQLIKCDEPMYTSLIYVCFIIVGIACIISIVLIYLRFMRHKRFYFWPFVRKESLARQMGSQGRNGQVTDKMKSCLITYFYIFNMLIQLHFFIGDGIKSINRFTGYSRAIWSCS